MESRFVSRSAAVARRGIAIVVAAAGLLISASAFAASFTVTTNQDANTGACTPQQCSLRDAFNEASTAGGPSTINLPAGSYRITILGAGEDDGAMGDFDIKGDVTLIGAGPALTRLSTEFLGEQIVDVAAGARLRVEGVDVSTLIRTGVFGNGDPQQTRLELSNTYVGNSNVPGITIDAQGQLMIEDSTIRGSNFSNGQRTILFQGPALDIARSTIYWKAIGIDARMSAGGNANFSSANLILGDTPVQGANNNSSQSTQLCSALNVRGGNRITFDRSQVNGGVATVATSCLNAQSIAVVDSAFVRTAFGYKALSVTSPATDIRNSTVVGSIVNNGTLALSAVTVGGISDYAGQGSYSLENVAGSVSVANSVMIGPCSGGNIVAFGNNVEAPGNSCGLPAASSRVNQTVASLELGELDYHGGRTLNYVTGSGTSPLVSVFTSAGITACLITDQRGFAREPECTIGATEFNSNQIFAHGFEF